MWTGWVRQQLLRQVGTNISEGFGWKMYLIQRRSARVHVCACTCVYVCTCAHVRVHSYMCVCVGVRVRVRASTHLLLDFGVHLKVLDPVAEPEDVGEPVEHEDASPARDRGPVDPAVVNVEDKHRRGGAEGQHEDGASEIRSCKPHSSRCDQMIMQKFL